MTTPLVDDFEKLGEIYSGGRFDLPTGQLLADLEMYDSQDLCTHAMCVGMTGSGKTGLCLPLQEEAALGGVPAIIVDPKGDLANIGTWFLGRLQTQRDIVRVLDDQEGADVQTGQAFDKVETSFLARPVARQPISALMASWNKQSKASRDPGQDTALKTVTTGTRPVVPAGATVRCLPPGTDGADCATAKIGPEGSAHWSAVAIVAG